jgi:hypothetical protein
MRRVHLLLVAAALVVGLAASTPPRAGCQAQLGPLWGPALCETEGLAIAWSVMDLREPAELAVERARFDARVASCLYGKDQRRPADRTAAFACVRDRVWARTRALAVRSDPDTLTGRWLADDGTIRGEARILAIAPNSIRVDVRTASRARGHECALLLDDAWTRRSEIAWKGVLASGRPESECDFSLRRTGRATFTLSSSGRCAWICGATADYRGTFRLQR